MSIDLVQPVGEVDLGVIGQDILHDIEVGIIELGRGDDIEVSTDDLLLEGLAGDEEVIHPWRILISPTTLLRLVLADVLLLLAHLVQISAPEEECLVLHR